MTGFGIIKTIPNRILQGNNEPEKTLNQSVGNENNVNMYELKST